jgi:hypothetical protein
MSKLAMGEQKQQTPEVLILRTIVRDMGGDCQARLAKIKPK